MITYQKEDFIVMLDSLQELFREYGDMVTPTLLMERDCRNSPPYPTDKLFTGQRLDSTGLYYYNARYYDPQIGRFISADTVIQNPANPQTLNRYSYCVNNPLKYTDPTGHVNVAGDAGEFYTITISDPFYNYTNGLLDGFADSFVNTGKTIFKLFTNPFGLASDILYSATHLDETWNAITDYYDVTTPQGVGHVAGDITQAIIIKKITEAGKAPPIPTEEVRKPLGLWSETAGDQAMARKLTHIFGNSEHNFDPLIAEYGGSQENAFKALEVATRNTVMQKGINGVFDELNVDVNGTMVTVGGNVENGILKIGTAYIPK